MIDEKALEVARRAIENIAWCDDDCEPLNAHDDAEQLARTAIEAYLGALDGVVLVPVEATFDMELALRKTWQRSGSTLAAYRAMIAARPQNEGE